MLTRKLFKQAAETTHIVGHKPIKTAYSTEMLSYIYDRNCCRLSL